MIKNIHIKIDLYSYFIKNAIIYNMATTYYFEEKISQES